MQNEKLASIRERFIQDLTRLRKQYGNSEISRKLGIDPGNLSRYATGAKMPGIKVIDQFYRVFADEIGNRKENIDQQRLPSVSDAGADYGYNQARPSVTIDDPQAFPMYRNNEAGTMELIATLKMNNEQLLSATNKMLDSSEKLFELPYKWLESFDKMIAVQEKSIQMALKMVEAHKIFLENFGGKVSK